MEESAGSFVAVAKVGVITDGKSRKTWEGVDTTIAVESNKGERCDVVNRCRWDFGK